MSAPSNHTTAGFTLLEMMLALIVLAAVMAVTYMAFSTVTMAWRKGTDLTEKLHHADFVIEQVVMALRSAYYPVSGVDAEFGLWHIDDGSGPSAKDAISWVKLGTALVGRDAPYAGGPHRVRLGVEEGPGGHDALAVRSWGLLQEVEDFDADELEPVFLPANVTGIDYRFEDPERDIEEEMEWIDVWEETNRVPKTIEITLSMEPLLPHEDPVEIKRIVTIPVAPLGWR